MWEIALNEMSSADVLIANPSITTILQKALRLREGGYNPAANGETSQVASPPGPRRVVLIEIFSETIRENSPVFNSRNDEDMIDPYAISKTIAHEIGHGIEIDHILVFPPPQCDQSQPGAAPFTVMTSGVTPPATSLTDPCWVPQNIPEGYLPTDLLQMRLR